MLTRRLQVTHAGLSLSLMFAAIFGVYGVQLPYLPVWLNWRGFGPAEIGMVSAAPLFLRLLVTPAIGFAADRLERHRGVMLLLIGCGLASILALAGTREFWPMLLLAVAFLVSIQTVLPLAETVALAAVRTASIDYGPVRLWGSIAFIGAGYVGGALLEASGPGAILWLLAGGTAAMAMTAYFLPSPRLDPISGEPSATGRERLTVAAVARVIGAPAFLLVLVAAGAVQASHAVYYAFGVLHWRSIGYSGGAIASLWAIGVVVEVGLFAFSRRLWERLRAVDLILIGGAAAVVRWIAMALDPSFPVLLALQTLHALTFGATHLGTMRYIGDAIPREQSATAQAVFSALTAGAGTGTATLIAGIAYEATGQWSYLLMAVMAGIGVGAALGLRQRLADRPAR